MDSKKIHWGRIIAGAVLLEVALIAVFVPLLALSDVTVIVRIVPIGTFAFGYLFGWWVVRKVPGRPVLHGTLVGVLATVIYLALIIAQPGGAAPVVAMYGPFLFVLGNALRIVGCAAAGFAYRRRME